MTRRTVLQTALFVSAGVYLTSLAFFLAPVLATSVGADDSYWILQAAGDNNGSYLTAFLTPLADAFEFEGQARTTALAYGERRVIALATMKLAVLFSVPPGVIWALLKVSLLVLSVAAVVFLLSQFRYRKPGGGISRISTSVIAFVALSLPLIGAIGAKAQTVGTVNGWMHYPSFTYGPFVVYLVVAACAIAAVRLADRRFGWLVVPLALVGVIAGFALNLTYEFLALTVPVTFLAVLMQPLPDVSGLWRRWRGRVVVLGAFGGAYTATFLWIRYRISQMACQLDSTCYSGTVIDLNPRTLVYSFLGAFPGGIDSVLAEQFEATGRQADGATATSVLLGVMAAGSLVVLCVLLFARGDRAVSDWRTSPRSLAPGEAVALVRIAALAAFIALGASAIGGVTARAVELVTTTAIPYRSGVITWLSIALVLAIVLRILLATRSRWFAGAIGLLAATAAITVVALVFPQNVLSAQVNRANANVQLIDEMHREVALGDDSTRGDNRRCESIASYLEGREAVSQRYIRSLAGAYGSFDYFYGAPYCSTGEGLELTSGQPLNESADR